MVDYARCQHCGNSYRRLRSDGKFCSDNCRVGWSQLPGKIKDRAAKAMDLLAQIRELVERYPHLKELADEKLLDVQGKATLEWVRLSQIENPATKTLR